MKNYKSLFLASGLLLSVSTLLAQGLPRSAISNIWPDSTVPFVIDNNFSEQGKILFYNAIEKISEKTCIQFRDAIIPDDTYWINVTHGEDYDIDAGCISGYPLIGRQLWLANSGQWLKIGPNCLFSSVFEHEIGHALDLPHEMERPDRDDYIIWDSTQPGCPAGAEPNPVAKNADQAALDIFYDYVSLMHEHDNKHCVIPDLPGPITLGASNPPPGSSENTFSVLDYEKLNAMYDCPGCNSYRFRKISQLASYHKALEAGVDYGGDLLYICRTYHNGGIVIGKSKPDLLLCYIGADGQEYKYLDNFEVLTNPKNANLYWTSRPDDSSIPENAIVGGRTVDRQPIYIARCLEQIWNGTGEGATPGALYIGDGSIGVPFNGVQVSCYDYEILVCSE